jgi:flagellar motor switch protein FliN
MEEDEFNPEENLPNEEMITPPREELSEAISPEEIPVDLNVEIGSVRMNLKKILELQPGNLVELGVKPEEGVFLTVNGKRFARAELLKVGEVLGVRILKLSR